MLSPDTRTNALNLGNPTPPAHLKAVAGGRASDRMEVRKQRDRKGGRKWLE